MAMDLERLEQLLHDVIARVFSGDDATSKHADATAAVQGAPPPAKDDSAKA